MLTTSAKMSGSASGGTEGELVFAAVFGATKRS